MSRKAKIIIAVVALLVIGGVAAALAFGSGSTAPKIDTAKVATGDLAVTVTASGRVESGARADVLPPTAGTLADVLVEDGAKVSAGTVIARMDTAPLEFAVAQAEAGVAQAEAQLAATDDQAPLSEDYVAAQAAVDAAWNGYRAANMALENVGAQAPSATDVSAAAAAREAAYDGYLAAKAAYDALNASIEASAAPSPAAISELEQLKIAKEQAYAGYLQATSAEEKLKLYNPALTETQAQAAADQALAGYRSAQSQQAKLKNTNLSPQRAAAQAGVDQARSALALAQDNLAKADLKAPIDGVVLFNALGTPSADGQTPKADVGSPVSLAAAPFTVVDLNALRFMAEVDEVDVDKVKMDMKASVALDAFSEPFATKVDIIKPAATLTATGGTVFPVYLGLEGVKKDVLIGMKGDATIEVDKITGATTIPVEALFDEGGTQYVYKVANDVLKKTEVKVGTLTDTQAQILSGVMSGDVVALSGTIEFKDGMKVRTK